MIPEIRDDQQMRALTGGPAEKLSMREAAFTLALGDEKERAYQERVAAGKRQSKLSGGQKASYPPYTTSWFFSYTT